MPAAFLMLAANTPWVYALSESLTEHGNVCAVRIYDWANYRRLKPQWPVNETPMRRSMIRLPQGYAGIFEPLFRSFLRAQIGLERGRLRSASGCEPIVVCPYPYLAPWVRDVPEANLVYYNLDDYVLYDPARAVRTTSQEDELVQRARLTLCLSVHQVAALRARHPSRKKRILHFPLGVVSEFLNSEPKKAPLPHSVGYVGNLTNRVDWKFVGRVAELVPEAKFHFVGNLDNLETGAETAGWQDARSRALARENVIYEGAVPQELVHKHYWRYAVNWMPYATDHPFNIASCPTKIMDALASGRPFVSTDIPEVRLYPENIRLVSTVDVAADELKSLLATAPPHASATQIEFAANNSWQRRANELVAMLDAITGTERTRNSLEM